MVMNWLNFVGGLLLFFAGTPLSIALGLEFWGRYGQSNDPVMLCAVASCSYVAVDCFFCSPAETLRAWGRIKPTRELK